MKPSKLIGLTMWALGVFLLALVSWQAATADAHRPPLKLAQDAAKRAARYQCYYVLFPLDPVEQRCRTYGVEADGGAGRDRRVAAGHGHANGSWVFPDAWVTNNSFRVIRFRLRVSYKCAANPTDGLPCVEYGVWISNIRPLAAMASKGFSDKGVRSLGR